MNMFETLKNAAAYGCSQIANNFCYGQTLYLATGALNLHDLNNTVNNCFHRLNDHEKGQVYGKVWELAKMQDPRIHGHDWGKDHAFDDYARLAKALHRLGLLNSDTNKHTVPCLSANFGEGGIGSQYFSLGEKLGKDPDIGQISSVNGMGVPSLEHAGRDAASLSNGLLYGYNVHCVYHATHQDSPQGDTGGFVMDVLRMKSVEGGSNSKTSYLIVQQWIDFFIAHPDKYYLQIAHSEGTAHVAGALRLLSAARPDLLSRVRVLNFCPAHFLDPSVYSPDLQVRNFAKLEDLTINPFGTGCHQLYSNCPHVYVVQHHGDHPHNHLSQDYTNAAKPFVDEFLRSGKLY